MQAVLLASRGASDSQIRRSKNLRNVGRSACGQKIHCFGYRLKQNLESDASHVSRNERKSDVVSDQINHPPHYNSGRIEVIEALEDWNLDFHRANAVKYIARAGKKGNFFVQDLQKAIWYLNRKIELYNSNLNTKKDARGKENSEKEENE